MRLSELEVGREGVVRSVDVAGTGEGRRLLDVGFVPGTRVRVDRRSPLGGPTVYEFRSTRLALRRAGANLIDVDPIAATATSDR